jgi:hypothetical protein
LAIEFLSGNEYFREFHGLARSLLFSITVQRCACSDETRRIHLDTNAVALNTSFTTPSRGKETAPTKRAFKSVPDNYRVLSEGKYHKIVEDLEAILLDISTDGIGINTPDGRISTYTLKSWAESLRNALETLSKAQ